MAVGSAALATRSQAGMNRGLKNFLSRYFYFSMALLMSGLAVWGFARTVEARLLHATPPRPLLLWFHAAVFSAWIVLFTAQSVLVRVRKVGIHRLLGWLGAAIAASMIVSGFIVSVVMLRFEMTVLHQANVASFLSVLWCDLIVFAACMAAAIYFRKRPEYHRRLVFLATSQMMQAAFVRLPYIGQHSLFFPALDVLIVVGMMRDLVVDRRINRVYVYVFPAMIVLQAWATYLARVNPSWWQAATHAVLGV